MNTLAYDPSKPPCTSILAILSPFIAAIGIPLNYACCLGLPFAFLALTFAIIPLLRMKKDPTLRGKPWAIAGLLLVALNLLSAAIMAAIILPSLNDLH